MGECRHIEFLPKADRLSTTINTQCAIRFLTPGQEKISADQAQTLIALNSTGGTMLNTSDSPRKKEEGIHVDAPGSGGLTLGLGILYMLGFAGACLLLIMEFHNIMDRIIGSP